MEKDWKQQNIVTEETGHKGEDFVLNTDNTATEREGVLFIWMSPMSQA